jgi:hypothetical protein
MFNWSFDQKYKPKIRLVRQDKTVKTNTITKLKLRKNGKEKES